MLDDSFFDQHPDPMWVFDVHSLQLLAANQAALAFFGYSLHEFLALGLHDLRPPDEWPALEADLALGTVADGRRRWSYRRKSGALAFGDIRARNLMFRGQQARLIVLRDVTELVSAQQRSEALSLRLEETLESITDAFFVLNPDWCFTYLNPQAEVLLARRRDDLLGRNVWQEFPAAVGTSFQVCYTRAVSLGETQRFTEFYSPLNTWFQVSAYPSAEGLAVYFRDVTQELANQHHLRLLQAAVSQQTDILVITEAAPVVGPQGPRIVYVNQAFSRVTGYAAADAIGRTPHFLQGPATCVAERARIREALLAGVPVRAELVNYTRDGTPFWLELDIAPLANPEGQLTHWVAVQRDISARKKLQNQAAESEERLRLVSQATRDVVWDWDAQAGTVWWSDAFHDLFGLPVASLEPGLESWTSRIHPDDRQRVLATIQAAIRSGLSEWTQEYRFRHAQSHYLTVLDRGFVVRRTEQMALRMLGSMVDVTERRELDERLRQAQRLEAVGQLTGGVAHDFNNLLTVIQGNAELMVERSAQTDMRQLAEMTLAAAERGAELTSRLLAFARRQPLQPQVLDLNRVVAEMAGLLQRTLPESVHLIFSQTPTLWHTELDPGQFETAVLNLVINARDAMPSGGSLELCLSNVVLDEAFPDAAGDVPVGDYVLLRVTDSGSGMAPHVARQAFDPFFTTKEVGKGSGLGLSMVYGFVKQSGGHIRIYSELDTGTTVTLYFPRARAQEAPMETPRHDTSQGGNEHILVVEDDSLVRQNLIAQLRRLGYRVTSAASAVQALELLQTSPDIQLLFTDVIMPGGMNGPQLAAQALQLKPDLKVLYTSGYTENSIVHQGRLDAGVHLLSKPYRRQEMALKVRQVLDNP